MQSLHWRRSRYWWSQGFETVRIEVADGRRCGNNYPMHKHVRNYGKMDFKTTIFEEPLGEMGADVETWWNVPRLRGFGGQHGVQIHSLRRSFLQSGRFLGVERPGELWWNMVMWCDVMWCVIYCYLVRMFRSIWGRSGWKGIQSWVAKEGSGQELGGRMNNPKMKAQGPSKGTSCFDMFLLIFVPFQGQSRRYSCVLKLKPFDIFCPWELQVFFFASEFGIFELNELQVRLHGIPRHSSNWHWMARLFAQLCPQNGCMMHVCGGFTQKSKST